MNGVSRTCPCCGAPVQSDSSYCVSCGADLQAGTASVKGRLLGVSRQVRNWWHSKNKNVQTAILPGATVALTVVVFGALTIAGMGGGTEVGGGIRVVESSTTTASDGLVVAILEEKAAPPELLWKFRYGGQVTAAPLILITSGAEASIDRSGFSGLQVS